MVASRRRPKGGLVTPFGLGFLTFIVAPSAIGSQDLAALVARQPVIAERPMSRFSLISTAHGATFTMPRPMSAAMPASLSYTLAGLDTTYADITGSIRERLLGEALLAPDDAELPVPNRALKGNRLPLRKPSSGRSDRAKTSAAAEPTRSTALRTAPRSLAARQRRSSARRRAPDAPASPEIGAPETVAPQDERGAAAEFADSLAIGIALHARRGRSGVPDGAALFRRRADGRDARAGAALAARRRAQGRDAGGLGRHRGATTASIAPDPTPADRRSSLPRAPRRNHRQQGRGHRRRPPSDVAGGAARPQCRRRAPSRRSASPKASISNRAASRCAARSRSRR